MSTDFNADVSTTLTSEQKLTQPSGKVANFCYDSTAYNSDEVAGVSVYNYDNHQNIPTGDATVLNTDGTILDKGVRSQASSITRMLLNHFFGRTSFNINKLADHLKNLLTYFKGFLKEGDNAWSPTIEYTVGDVVYFMTEINHEPCKRTFQCIVDCPSANLPPVYTDGSLINTTYWKEISGVFASVTIGKSNSGNTNVMTVNGSVTINGNITQSGTTYVTHAEQIYTKKDNIITREDATGALGTGYSGIKVNNYDGNGKDGILAYRGDGTAVVGDYIEGATPPENLQPLLTRDEASNLGGGLPLAWDSVNKRAYTTQWGSAGAQIINPVSPSTVILSPVPVSVVPTNGLPLSVVFTANVSASDDTTGLSLSYTSGGTTTNVPVKVNKGGTLVALTAHEIATNIFRYIDAWTTLDLIYVSDDGSGNPAFVVVGNPIVLSGTGYTIYADGKIGNENIGDVKSTSLTKIPYGWHECDGSAISRTIYSELFNLFNTETYDDDPTHTLLSVYGVGDGSTTFNLPDYREVALVGVGKNTTNIFDSTETDPRTGQAGTQNHDIYTVGYFGDDRFQDHMHYLANGAINDGVLTTKIHATSIGGNQGFPDNISANSGRNIFTYQYFSELEQKVFGYTSRQGSTTRTKQKGVTYIIKII